jgi:hypothetical protein
MYTLCLVVVVLYRGIGIGGLQSVMNQTQSKSDLPKIFCALIPSCFTSYLHKAYYYSTFCSSLFWTLMSAPMLKWLKVVAAYLEAFNISLFKLNCIAQK